MGKPLVSAVCPTKDRRLYIPQMIRSFLSQTWEPKELVILDDGEETIADIIPKDPRIRFYRTGPSNIPTKRNTVNELAEGEIIIHFDDDDYSTPGRMEEQVRNLISFRIGIVGYHSILFYDERTGKGWKYLGNLKYACGTSFCYWRNFWKSNPFPEAVDLGSDNKIIYPAMAKGNAQAFDGERYIVARIHSKTSNPKSINGENYVPRSLKDFPEGFLNEIANFCNNSSSQGGKSKGYDRQS